MSIELVLLSRVAYRGQEISASGMRGLLALLAGEPRTGCSTARLVDGLWSDGLPEHPAKALQILVSRARARLGADVILSTPAGYLLALGEDQVDASAVLLEAAACEQRARAGDHISALRHAEAGLALCEGVSDWGSALQDPLSALRAARVSTYRSLVRARALALSRLGRPAEAVEPLAELAVERPRDEEVLTELLRCEAATVGAPTALVRYDAYRRALREELGSEPGPALRSAHRELLLSDLPVVRHGVRHEPNPMLGRDRDVAAVAELLRSSRVTSIVGAGGLGKTRLAHAVSRRADQRVVHFVELAGVTVDGDVADEVASALGVREGGPLAARPGGLAGIVDALGPGPALLVLDNCEHVVLGAAELVRGLVSLSSELRVLTTSRAPLGLSSESVYPLPELDLETVVELFGQRARAVRPDLDLPPAVVRELCGRLDGLPLAVELAAARVRVMSVGEIARRLHDRFAVLRGGTRDAPRRHRTLHAVIDWSWHLLEPDGQAAMRALSVFPGGFGVDAARHLLGDDVVLEQVVDQSLLKVVDSGSGTRLRMLESVREFGAARREELGETDRVVDRFLSWARDFGARQERELAAGFFGAADEIRAEQDNLLLALRYGLDREDGETVAVVTAMLGSLWVTESNFTRLGVLAEDTAWVLSHARPEPAFVEATRTAAVLCALIGFVMPDLRPLRALVTLRALPLAAPDTLIRASHVALCAPDVPTLHEMSDGDEPLLAGIAAYVLSYVREGVGDQDGALREARRMLARLPDDAPPLIRALTHARLGELCLQADPGEAAFRHLEVALSIMAELGWRSTAIRGEWALVLANLQRGAFDEAERGLAEAARDSGVDTGLAMFDVCARAEILLGRGDVEGGLRLWRRAADGVRSPDGDPSGGGLWAFEVEAVAVVTHARHGRLDLVREICAALPSALSTLLASVQVPGFPVCGSLLVAVAVVDLDRGATASGARLIALAERFRLLRSFQPTMSPERVRALAEQADRQAYSDAVSSYARLDHDGLRAAAVAALRARDQLTGPDPA